jgi:hypothetical protein
MTSSENDHYLNPIEPTDGKTLSEPEDVDTISEQGGDRSTGQDQRLIQVAAQIQRHTLVGQARKVTAANLSPETQLLLPMAERMLKLDQALIELAKHDPKKALMVELCYFAGIKKADAANALGLSPEQFQREWSFTKAWLRRHIAS